MFRIRAIPVLAGLQNALGRCLATWITGLLLPVSLQAESAASTPGKTDPTLHWAYQPIQRPAVPGTGNPVDAFIGATLERKGLRPNPPAEPRTLVRRLYFDLTGLPPTPAELDAFEQDASPGRYERLVDRLLASPRYGERWGRHWLDVVRYTESQGFEYDRPRDNAWPYRDYVIRSLNADKPYDQFMREQVAGDVLEPVTAEGIIGASLLVSGPWDQAGNSQANATQRAITREEEMDDLVGVVGQTFLGVTINCARCHDHKFDPIPLADYYRVKAVFDGVKHGERPAEDPEELEARKRRRTLAELELTRAVAELDRIESDASRALLREANVDPTSAPGPIPMLSWSFGSVARHASPGTPHDGARISDGRLVLPSAGAYFESAPIPKDLREKTLEAWVSLADLQQGGGAAISIERTNGTVFDAIVFGERQPGKWMAGSESFSRTRDLEAPLEDAPPGAWVHVAVVYSGDRTIACYRNGQPYGLPYSAGNSLTTFKAGEARIVLGRRHRGGSRPWLTGAVLQASVYDRALSASEVTASFQSGPDRIPREELLKTFSSERRDSRDAALAAQARARREIAEADRPVRVAYAGVRQQPGPTRTLKRGDVKSPGDTVRPSGLSAIHAPAPDLGLSPDAPEALRRVRFADWLADPRNPLPPRVLVNRVWQFHFGQGLVSTPSDFGVSGAHPSHPELLDWLASEFIARGWSLKVLHRLLVLSDTYRQSSDFRADAAALDADNQLLWRFPPRRLEGEAVRDAMLSVSGQLNLQLGGPSFRPFTTSEYGATFYHLFDKGDPEFNRRTVYRMNINSGKEPLLDALDCPDPSVKTPRRGVTTTPLQALGLMNSSFVQRQAASMADRALRLAGNHPDRALETAWRLALGRPPSEQERRSAGNAAKERGLSHVCWVLLNSTEFVYVR